MASKDPITCHVLDTLTGRPAPGMSVTLSTAKYPELSFAASTNTDGRISTWGHPISTSPAGTDSVKTDNLNVELILEEDSIWKLRFDTGGYYGERNTFWPFVDLTFVVKKEQHYHVPLLLGPYSYTTYRGS